MRWLLVFVVACSSSTNGTPAPAPKPEPAKPAAWTVPVGWKSEVIPFPLGFAPTIQHTGDEELRFPKGFFDAKSGEYFSYTFIWRTTDAAVLDANQLAAELTVYFQGLTAEVDKSKQRTDARPGIAVTATANGPRFDLAARTYDPFTTSQVVDLTGWAERVACGSGALWVFVLAPAATTIRTQLDELATAAKATCDRG
jgi:hypothetical protein